MSIKKPLSVLSLVAINIIAVDSLRTLPFGAEYGFSAVFYYLVAAFVFFLPVSLVSAELATAFPETGGVYVWTREAFGKKVGFLTTWLQWFYNIVWYPTIMSLVAVTIAYVFSPALANNKSYMLSVIMISFWSATCINCLGMKAASWLSTSSAIIGTLVPMILVTILGASWLLAGKPIQINFSLHDFFPDFNIHHMVLFIAMLYGLIGMEMSASHAHEVRNPQRDYPKAAFYAMAVILATLVLGSLAIAIVVPVAKINVISGLLQAYMLFFGGLHITWFIIILAIMIVFGAIGGAAAWMLGPSKGMLAACRDGSLPMSLAKVSKNNIPTRILLLQGIVFTLLCSVFILMPTITSAFWVLTDITAILALVVYIIMFAAAIKLRYKFPHHERAFKIPGGKFGLWLTCSLGFLTCVFAISIGFIPPSQIPVGNIITYESIIAVGVVAGCFAPFGLMWLTKRLGKWK